MGDGQDEHGRIRLVGGTGGTGEPNETKRAKLLGDYVSVANGHMRNGHRGRVGPSEQVAAGGAGSGQAAGLPGSRGVIATEQQYRQLVQQLMPPINRPSLLVRAFVVGGTLSLVGQFVLDFFTRLEPTEGQAIAATLATMILLGAVLTAVGVYDFLGEWGGFGAAVPITGFANSMVAAAMDFRREGFVSGLSSKMFVIAGPVIVFGIIAGMLAGSLAWLFKAIGG